MGKVKAVWQADREKVEMGMHERFTKKNDDPYNLWDNDDRGDAMISETDLGALMAKWEEL
jgi:hypothetical protein